MEADAEGADASSLVEGRMTPGPSLNPSGYLARHKLVNLAIDSIVQLNSALAYIISQSFYGGPPLLQNLSLNSCHSLLGIGTAIRAIQTLTEFIIHGFAKHPVAQTTKLRYKDITLKTSLLTDHEHPNAAEHSMCGLPTHWLRWKPFWKSF